MSRHRRGGSGACAHGAAEFAQEQQLRRLERLVAGVLPHPGAFRIGSAECGFHGGTQGAAVERMALAQ